MTNIPVVLLSVPLGMGYCFVFMNRWVNMKNNLDHRKCICYCNKQPIVTLVQYIFDIHSILCNCSCSICSSP